MVIKVKPIVKEGTHLTVTNHQNGKFDLVWDWDKLLEEVQAACATGKINLVEVTEAKVKKTRAKKVNKVK